MLIAWKKSKSSPIVRWEMLNPAACCVVFSCLYVVLWISSTAGMLFQCILDGNLLSRHPLSQVSPFWFGTVAVWLPAVAVLGGSIYQTFSTSLFQSGDVIKHCQKKVFIRWLLTLSKSAKKYQDALHTHFTQAYWRLILSLPTIINSWLYAITYILKICNFKKE